MADLSQQSVLALTVQSGAGIYNAPTSADAYPVFNLRPQIAGVTIDNPEYLGTVHRPGPVVGGKTAAITCSFLLRPPGGAAPPVAGAYIPGRALRSIGFTENIVSAAIPAAPEALGTGSTTTAAKLGTTAAATADLYRGLALNLAAGGVYPRSLTAIRAYDAAKLATVAETFGAAPTGNYQIPRQLAYQLSDAAPSILLSAACWLGTRRYNMVDLAPQSATLNFPVSTRENLQYPSLDVTFAGDLHSDADETAPTIAALGAVPLFRDGDFWVANRALGGSSFSIDLGLSLGFPPNPNRTSGNDAAQVTGTTRSISLNLNQAAKSAIDLIGLADAQAYHALWAQFGYAAGAIVSLLVPDARFNYQSPDPSGDFVTTQGDMIIDGANKSINLLFPY